MELLILGVLIGAGAAKRKSVTKALAKGYLAVKETSSHMRADLQEAIREAKSEQDNQQIDADIPQSDPAAEITALHEEASSGVVVAVPALLVSETIHESGKFDDLDCESASAEVDGKGPATPKPSVAIIKGVARGFVKVSEMTRSAAAHVREDVRDAIEEAKYERELSAARRESGSTGEAEAVASVLPIVVEPTETVSAPAAPAPPVKPKSAAPSTKSASPKSTPAKPKSEVVSTSKLAAKPTKVVKTMTDPAPAPAIASTD